jgi:hypothetical protein
LRAMVAPTLRCPVVRLRAPSGVVNARLVWHHGRFSQQNQAMRRVEFRRTVGPAATRSAIRSARWRLPNVSCAVIHDAPVAGVLLPQEERDVRDARRQLLAGVGNALAGDPLDVIDQH